MAFDFADEVQKFINSPPGQLAAGGVLAGIVWKFFERVEGVLTDTTKFEIAVWLVGVNLGQTVEPWPETFAKVFDRVFGKTHLSWRCFYRSSLASLLSVVLVGLVLFFIEPGLFSMIWRNFRGHPDVWIICIIIANIVPDYLSLLESRFILSKMQAISGYAQFTVFAGWMFFLIAVDITITFLIADLASVSANRLTRLGYEIIGNREISAGASIPGLRTMLEQGLVDISLKDYGGRFWLWVYPAFFTSVWLWLYAGAGFLLKTARRFDMGFDLFNRKFDIEKRPLSAIGLVAGLLVAVAYWGFALAVHFVLKPLHTH